MVRRLIPLLLLSFYGSLCYAEVKDSAGVVAERGNVKLTFGDIDVVLEKVPSADRAAVVAGGERLQQIIDSELLNKQLVQLGREMKFSQSSMVQRQLERAAELELAKMTVDEVVKDAKRPNFTVLAKEYYTVNNAEFVTPLTSVVQHILISKEAKSAAEVAAKVQEVMLKAQAPGAKFDDLVNEYSDDPSKSENHGVMSVGATGQFVASFETAAHALKQSGDLSQVETEYGTHILLLVRRSPAGVKPFEAVREEIITKLSNEFEVGIRTKLFSDLRSANPQFHEEMINAVRNRYGELPKIGGEPTAPTVAPAADGSK